MSDLGAANRPAAAASPASAAQRRPPPIPDAPAIEYREAGQDLPALIAPEAKAAAKLRITGTSNDIYAGWSLIASVTGLAADRRLDLDAPVILEPDEAGHHRMLSIGIEEIGDAHDEVRRFLVKAYAIDADKEGRRAARPLSLRRAAHQRRGA